MPRCEELLAEIEKLPPEEQARLKERLLPAEVHR